MGGAELEAVASRLRQTGLDEEAAERSRERILAEGARTLGGRWAREYATATKLRNAAEINLASPAAAFFNFYPAASLLRLISRYRLGSAPDPADRRGWEHFAAGAREVWEAVQPLLDAGPGARNG